MFLHCCFWSIFFFFFFCFYVKNPKKHKKLKTKKFDWLCWVLTQSMFLPCTFVLMAVCIYERSLFPMHLYYCGRTLDIYVIVVNRSSNLSWMISEWFCWSWDMHRLMPIYLPTCLFYCFCLKSSPNVNLQMKRDIELQNLVAHTSIWLGKRESDLK